MSENTQKFWMVWSPSGRSPTHRHYSREAADLEAARLARLAPGSEFFVLKAVGGKTVPLAQPSDIKLVAGDELRDDIPF